MAFGDSDEIEIVVSKALARFAVALSVRQGTWFASPSDAGGRSKCENTGERIPVNYS